MIGRIRRALTDHRAATRPDHDDASLRGRTYAVPFERVWRAALEVASGRSGWAIVDSDDLEGYIRIEAKTPVLRFVDDVEIRIGLDADAQTRVDMTSESRKGKMDFGTNARRIRRFFKHLDRRIREGRRAAAERR